MFRKAVRGWQHTLTLIRAAPNAETRRLLGRMIDFSRFLPRQFDQPLPLMMQQLTPPSQVLEAVEPETVRRLADAVAAWHVRSPLGICLRRSLLRYYFLHEADVPVQIVFGARLKGQAGGGGLGGHAWLKLDGLPYYENPKDYEGFVEMFVYPEDRQPSPVSSKQSLNRQSQT